MNRERSETGAASASLAVRIRDADVADAEAIEAVHFASRKAVYEGLIAQWPPPGPDRSGRVARWRQWLADPSIECFVVETGGEVVGLCTVRPSPDEEGGVAEMPTLYIRPDSWRRGYGRALCMLGMERAASLGFHTLTLWVMEINPRARAFYERLGFTPDGARKEDEGAREGLMADRYRIALESAGT
jgi:RimJ/RimL family protein N-acetyltransferase